MNRSISHCATLYRTIQTKKNSSFFRAVISNPQLLRLATRFGVLRKIQKSEYLSQTELTRLLQHFFRRLKIISCETSGSGSYLVICIQVLTSGASRQLQLNERKVMRKKKQQLQRLVLEEISTPNTTILSSLTIWLIGRTSIRRNEFQMS